MSTNEASFDQSSPVGRPSVVNEVATKRSTRDLIIQNIRNIFFFIDDYFCEWVLSRDGIIGVFTFC